MRKKTCCKVGVNQVHTFIIFLPKSFTKKISIHSETFVEKTYTNCIFNSRPSLLS